LRSVDLNLRSVDSILRSVDSNLRSKFSRVPFVIDLSVMEHLSNLYISNTLATH